MGGKEILKHFLSINFVIRFVINELSLANRLVNVGKLAWLIEEVETIMFDCVFWCGNPPFEVDYNICDYFKNYNNMNSNNTEEGIKMLTAEGFRSLSHKVIIGRWSNM